jgi:NAD(P)-dependent dehydrogenase (short-subunit alcohol dehydrogenase family)
MGYARNGPLLASEPANEFLVTRWRSSVGGPKFGRRTHRPAGGRFLPVRTDPWNRSERYVPATERLGRERSQKLDALLASGTRTKQNFEMDDFRGKLAVISGAGTGMGRELALQLVRAGAHVAICDVFPDTLAEAKTACEAGAGASRVSAHSCDVADEAQVLAFRDAVAREHGSDHIHLLFNNAGIAGGGSFIAEPRERWERTFNVCWFGVYYCTRAFLPMLIKSTEACIINTSSINGVFAISPLGPHTAYSTAKFAIKGFSEALLTDLRVHAPHVRVVLVMPGHIGTSIVVNTLRSHGTPSVRTMTQQELTVAKANMARTESQLAALDDEQFRSLLQQRVDAFHDMAPMSAAQAATIILDGVLDGSWRILVGEDARIIDQVARENPEKLYEPMFLQELSAKLTHKS